MSFGINNLKRPFNERLKPSHKGERLRRKEMKLPCQFCRTEEAIWVEFSGPHLKATCQKCGSFIKFLSRKEKKLLEMEEDKLNYNHPERRDRGRKTT